METQKITNLLDGSQESKFPTKKWYVIDTQTAKGKYSQNNYIKFATETFFFFLSSFFFFFFFFFFPFLKITFLQHN